MYFLLTNNIHSDRMYALFLQSHVIQFCLHSHSILVWFTLVWTHGISHPMDMGISCLHKRWKFIPSKIPHSVRVQWRYFYTYSTSLFMHAIISHIQVHFCGLIFHSMFYVSSHVAVTTDLVDKKVCKVITSKENTV